MPKTIQLHFEDKATLSDDGKTAISVRDGVLEYSGAEIGMEPADKIFTVLRTPATIANAAMRMQGIPVTNEHVSLSEPAPTEGGSVITAEMIDVKEDGIVTIAIKNKIKLSDQMLDVAKTNRELSLGYIADLVEHDEYDFEQKDIIPHHLAIVPSGRCGTMCSFIDRKPTPENQMKIKFIDANGVVNMKTIMEVMALLPEAIKTVPLDQLESIIPVLEELVSASREIIPQTEEAVTDPTAVNRITGEGMEDAEEVKEDVMIEDADEVVKEDVETKDAEDDEDEDDKKDFSDSTAFKDAVAAAVKTKTADTLKVIEKAKTFLADTYSFADKAPEKIMRDALKTQSSEKFEDAELSIAFKLLKQNADYKDFGDSKDGYDLEAIANKEM